MKLIYLHGFASSPASKKARFFAERFAAQGIAVEVPRLDGGDFEHLTISGQLRVIERSAGGAPVSLIGSSMGGYLAALYASRHPEARRLVLMAPAFGILRRWPEGLGAQRFDEWRREGTLDFFHYSEQRSLPLSWDLIEDGAQYEDSPDFSQPALIFHGRTDNVVPFSASVEFASGHPNVQLELLDSDHELTGVLETMWQKTYPFLAEGL